VARPASQNHRRSDPISNPIGSSNLGLGSMHDNIANHDLNDTLQGIRNQDFEIFSQKAYDNADGYSLRRNPLTGETEMFVAGTRTTPDWIADVYEGLNKNAPAKYRDKYVKKLEDIAKYNHVTVIYGHSRGGAIVNQMNVPGASVLELDGADNIDRGSNVTWNIIQDQMFDHAISNKGKDVTVLPGKVPMYETHGWADWYYQLRFGHRMPAMSDYYHRASRSYKGWHKESHSVPQKPNSRLHFHRRLGRKFR